MAPLILIMTVNCFAFIRIIVILVQQSSKRKKQMRSTTALSGDKDGVPSFLSPIQIRGTITLFVLLGSGWIIGLLAVGPFELVFRYAYTILNAGNLTCHFEKSRHFEHLVKNSILRDTFLKRRHFEQLVRRLHFERDYFDEHLSEKMLILNTLLKCVLLTKTSFSTPS
jgi:hypothetical protein